MDISLFYKGLIIGVSIAAPVGPIGVLCIQRTLIQGRLVGLVSGLGAATADMVYGLIAGFGLTFITQFLIGQQFWIQMGGGLFLVYLGIKTLTSRSEFSPETIQKKNILRAFISVFIQTLTNPMTILSFTAIFAGLGISSPESNTISATLLVLGVFCGSAIWWIFLSSGMGMFKNKIHSKSLSTINQLSGVIIIIFGVFALYGLF